MLDTPVEGLFSTYADKKGPVVCRNKGDLRSDRLSYEELLDTSSVCMITTKDPEPVWNWYRSAIFYLTESQQRVADAVGQGISIRNVETLCRGCESRGLDDAEDYHQDYLVIQPDGYTCRI